MTKNYHNRTSVEEIKMNKLEINEAIKARSSKKMLFKIKDTKIIQVTDITGT